MSIAQSHSIRLYFPYLFDSSSAKDIYSEFIRGKTSASVSELVESASFLSNDIHANLLEANLWIQSECKLDKRFHDFSSQLVNGIPSLGYSNGFFGLSPLALSQEALRVLNQGTPNNLGTGISIELKKSSVSRLAEQSIESPLGNNRWPMMFNSIVFYGLNTGAGMLVVDLSFKQPGKKPLAIEHLEELIEINYAIARNSNDHQSAQLCWNFNDESTEQQTSLTKGLSPLLDALLPVDKNDKLRLHPTTDRNNTYAYTFVASEQPMSQSDKDDAIFRMSRKYNDLYLPENPQQQVAYFKPFKTLTHAFSLEGAVTFVDFSEYSDQVPESIKNFDRTAIPQAYAPLILLTYAEYIFLRDMATSDEDDKRVDMRNPTDENLSRLRDFRSRLYDFRLNFRYTQISSNTNHNLFCNTNKQALQIDALLSETSSDVEEIEQYIADQVSQQQDARLKKFGIMGSLFAVIIGWVDLWGLNFHDIIYKYEETELSSMIVFILVLLGLTIAVVKSGKTSVTDKPRSKRKS
ncbi:MAG: hypothetical protein KUG78_19025 [Kangiellaceae bacterium]|nr:hypothetical protein [Kangiellaceae bacterium]